MPLLILFFLTLFLGQCEAKVALNDVDVINVMTFNIRVYDAGGDSGNRHWTKRRAYVENIINQKIDEAKLNELNMIDFLGLQEGNWPELKIFNQVVAANHHNNTKGNLGYINFGESVKLYYRSDRWALDDLGVLEVGSDQWGRRIVGWAHFLDMHGENRGVYVLNSHWPVHGKINGELVTEWIAKRANKQHPVIMMGDFNNGSADHSFFHNEQKDVDLVSVYSKLHVPSSVKPGMVLGTHSGWGNAWDSSRIDHIFVSSEKMKKITCPLKVEHAEIIHYPSEKSGDTKLFASDHFPLFTQLRFVK